MSDPLCYILHCGNLYGTERMALATLEGLRTDFTPILMTPPGLVVAEALARGITVHTFDSAIALAKILRQLLAQHSRLVVMDTALKHSLLLQMWNLVYRRSLLHLHIVHGGTNERQSYGRKHYLNFLDTRFVANSEFVRQRLIKHGVIPERITVIENFLSAMPVRPRHEAFTQMGIREIIVVSRVDSIKRVDLLLEALTRHPQLSELSVRVLGTGEDLDKLRDRAEKFHPNVQFLGFVMDVPEQLITADLLVHLCPVEPFGLAIVEAIAANVPVLVPDSGGAASLVEDGVSGFHFHANDVNHLANRLLALMQTPPHILNRVVEAARQSLVTRFSAERGINQYRQLLGRVINSRNIDHPGTPP